MPDDLYSKDILAWSKAQADRLRRLAAGERVNDLDWAHVIEEIEDLGRSEFNGVQSLLFEAILHAMKIACLPQADAAQHWQHELVVFLAQARRRMQPAMVRRIELDGLYGDALAAIRTLLDAPPPLPATPPFTRKQLADRRFDARALIAALTPAG